MDLDVGTLLSTIIGGFIAVASSWLFGLRQRRWQKEDTERALTATRDAEVRKRADEKADEVLTELDALERLLLGRIRLTGYLWPPDPEVSFAVKDTLNRLGRATQYLQQPLRMHLDLARRILNDADPMRGHGFLREAPVTVGHHVVDHARDIVGKYLRNEPVPPELDERHRNYEKAWQTLQDYNDWMVERAEAEAEAQAVRAANEAALGDAC
ncbi:hypothetical protein [Georgenia yuyongxinii]|uniref:Uncharacterized protein n=1 Tax=Georgenia yuyongxinii TaxID=2589797 RepID=A0A552WU37_9MICO|nr:hypothetical protein [Georgenia yuyongxinii]TRW46361.1 hypothetical protein FJ693_05395 [Georgenia yuyongxinii]